MATQRSQNDRGAADERAVRAFLERAAPIILESDVLEGERFQSVCALAEELGLSRDQLACELRFLEQRGVISSAPWDRLEDQAEERGPSSVAEPGGAPQERAPAPGVDRPRIGGRPERSSQPSDPSAVARPPERTSPDSAANPVVISPTASALEALRSRALKQLARQGTLSAKARQKLEKAGRQAGLSLREIASVLEALPDQQRPDTLPATPSREAASPAPVPAVRTPSESFRRWILQKLSGYPSSILAAEDEQGLIGVGVHRYHLAEVLATHLVRDVATEGGFRLARDLEAASCNSTVGTATQASADDHKLQEFLEQVAPILTQHRGINVQSRVMLSAAAERLGLTQAELERALATLQRSAIDSDENDPRQRERRESYRAYLCRTLAQLPQGIITFKTEERLRQAGELFHGVAPKWIKATMNEVAAEIGVRFISKEQALEHVTQLVESQLHDRPVLDNTMRARIYTEGTRWGLDPLDVDVILRERTETLRRRLAAERRRTRWVLNFVVGGLCVAGTIVALMLVVQSFPSHSASQQPRKTATAPATGGSDLRAAWWDDDVRVALARLRARRPDLRSVLDRLASEQASARSEAAGELVAQFTQRLPSQELQEAMQHILVSFYARDPSDAAAHALADSLLKAIVSLDARPPEHPASLKAMFWSCRVVVAMLKYPQTPVLRRNRLAEQWNKALLVEGDPLLERAALEQLYVAALAQRLYRLVTDMAAADVTQAGPLFRALHELAPSCLDAVTQERLEVEYLAAAIPAAESQWDRYESILQTISRSADPNTVVKLLDIYRSATDVRLRGSLVHLFLDRLGAASGTLTETEMLDQIRESVGVASRERANQRWNLLTATARELLDRPRVDNSRTDVLLQETMELAHAATLGCALSRGEAGGAIFDALQKTGPVRLPLDPGRNAKSPPTALEPSSPVTTQTLLRNYIGNLSEASNLEQRLSLLGMIGGRSGSVRDIYLPSGLLLAEYLVRPKSNDQEYQQVLQHVASLARWNAVRLGLADQLLDGTGRDSQVQEVYARALEGPVNLATDAGRDDARRRLLAQVVASLPEEFLTEEPAQRPIDEASRALRGLFAAQAKLLGVPAESYSAASQPSQVVAALVQQLAAELSGAKLDAESRALLDQLPHRLRALDFVAENDLQRTAGLQHIQLQLLALHVLRQRPDQAAGIAALGASPRTIAPGASVFEQLRDLQADLLRVWLLLHPASEAATPDNKVGPA